MAHAKFYIYGVGFQLISFAAGFAIAGAPGVGERVGEGNGAGVGAGRGCGRRRGRRRGQGRGHGCGHGQAGGRGRRSGCGRPRVRGHWCGHGRAGGRGSRHTHENANAQYEDAREAHEARLTIEDWAPLDDDAEHVFDAYTGKNSCVGFARDAHLSEGSAVHRRHVHDGEQPNGPLQEGAQHPSTQRDGMHKHRRRTRTAHPSLHNRRQNLPAVFPVSGSASCALSSSFAGAHVGVGGWRGCRGEGPRIGP
mmetsp:Transcript_31711/g.101091  ORF Transcript_31711/g.101091 Transcript_31711/m.101091 type:complete len:251 (+) Transcript_31711:650-1402(+)